jgi:hypothetical protein
MFYPIIADDDGDANGAKSGFPFRSFSEFIENILPHDRWYHLGIWQRVDKPSLTVLTVHMPRTGRGDLHDTKYNYMGVRTDLVTIQSSSS